MRDMDAEDCGCNCRGGRRGMHRYMDFGGMDLAANETAERLRYYKDDLAEEIKLIDRRIADLEAEVTRKGSK